MYYDSLVNIWMYRGEDKVSLAYSMKSRGGNDIYLRLFLNKALDKVSGQLHAPAALLTGENSLVNIK